MTRNIGTNQEQRRYHTHNAPLGDRWMTHVRILSMSVNRLTPAIVPIAREHSLENTTAIDRQLEQNLLAKNLDCRWIVKIIKMDRQNKNGSSKYSILKRSCLSLLQNILFYRKIFYSTAKYSILPRPCLILP